MKTIKKLYGSYDGDNIKSILLSVVIISKNEEKNIRSCILSIINNLNLNARYEIILIDSNSTDATIEIAKQFPIKIYQLSIKQPESPAAGRYMGYIKSKGKFIFYIDGDMVLKKGFIQKALTIMKKEKRIGGLAGIRYNINGNIKSIMDKQFGYIQNLEGPALFRRSTLLKTKPYNPFIKGGEEEELSIRIRSHNYLLMRIKIPMVYHYSNWDKKQIYINRPKYYIGYGQIIKKILFTKYLFQFIRHHCLPFISAIQIILTIQLLILILLSTDFIVLSCSYSILSNVVIISGIAIKKKKMKSILYSYIGLYLMGIYVLIGICYRTDKMSKYPLASLHKIK